MSSATRTPVPLLRDCEVTIIPGGAKMLLHAGDEVTVTQSLGGTFTVMTGSGYLARIAGSDADAIGLEPPEQPRGIAAAAGPVTVEQVLEELKAVFDPEIPINVVDLGLIYGCEVLPIESGQRVEIKMSMTAPGCGMGDVLADDAKAVVQAMPGVGEVDVELVWDPPWDLTRTSEAARIELGMW